MTSMAISTCDFDHAAPRASFHPFGGLWLAAVQRHRRRQLQRRLYGIEPRLLTDMGFDPAEVYDAFSGTLGEVHGDRFRGLALHEATGGK